MSKLVWDKSGARSFETGVSMGVLYPMSDTKGTYAKGVAWNGLTSVSESPEGAEVTSLYADNIKYLNLISAEDLKGTIEAYTYPDEFGECDGSKELATGASIGQQSRKMFALCYKTKIGSDVDSEATDYKLHIIYGCLASPSERSYETVNDSPEAITFSWEFSTTPVNVTGFQPTASVIIDSRKADADKLKELEDKLYGTDGETSGASGTEPTLVLPDEIKSILA